MERIKHQLIDQKQLAMQVLSWIIYARRSLTTTELQHALGVEVGESKLDEDNLPEVEDMVSVCAGLVTVDKESGVTRLVHYTTQEYFDRTREKWFPDAEMDITRICVIYLSFNEFERGICCNDEDFEERLRVNRLYNYASHNWGHHARRASTLIPEVISFLKRNAQAEASGQALLAVKLYSLQSNYSQNFPRQMIGIHLAAFFGVVKAVRLLLSSDSPNLNDSYNRTPLSYAAMTGHEAVVKLLLDVGEVNVNAKDINGYTPLSYASNNGHEAVVKLLLDVGEVNVNAKDINGYTPLSYAANNGHEAVVKLLLDTGKVDVSLISDFNVGVI